MDRRVTLRQVQVRQEVKQSLPKVSLTSLPDYSALYCCIVLYSNCRTVSDSAGHVDVFRNCLQQSSKSNFLPVSLAGINETIGDNVYLLSTAPYAPDAYEPDGYAVSRWLCKRWLCRRSLCTRWLWSFFYHLSRIIVNHDSDLGWHNYVIKLLTR